MSLRIEGECGQGANALSTLARAFAVVATTTLVACSGGGGGGSDGASLTSNSPAPTPSPSPSPTPAAFSGKFVESWSTANSAVSYTLSVLDEKDGRKAATIDTLPVTSTTGVARIRGGAYSGATGNVTAPITRFIVYSKSGGIYKLPLETTGAAPLPVRLSTEANLVALPSGAVVAQSLSGDEALLRYDTNILGQARYVRLSMVPASEPIDLGTSPFTSGGAQQVVSGITDPGSGALVGYLLIDGARLYRTDANFANAVILQPYAQGFQLPGAEGAGKMRNGFFFVSDGVLRRFDYAKGSVQVVSALTNNFATAAVADDTAFYVLYEGAAGFAIVKANDALDSTGTILVPSIPAPGGGATPLFSQTKDYLLFVNAAGQAVSVRKSDGAQTNLGGLAGDWNTISFTNLDGPAGNRVFYSKADVVTGRRIVGSINADGTDRRELLGAAIAGVRGSADVVQGHRLQTGLSRGPFARLLVAIGDITSPTDLKGDLAWINSTTGGTDFVAGAVGSSAIGLEPSGAFNPGWIGAGGAFTFAPKSLAGLGLSRNSYYLRQAAGSLLLAP